MYTIRDHARRAPQHPALAFSNGAVVTYGELNSRASQLAHLLQSRGLQKGDHVALYMENNLRFLDVIWASLLSGLYITPINWHLPPEDAAYIANDCGAKVIISSHFCSEMAAKLPAMVTGCHIWLMTDGVLEGWESYEAAVDACSTEPLAEEW